MLQATEVLHCFHATCNIEQQQLLAEAIKTEGKADAKGIQEMNNALAGAGGEAIVKLRIAEAMQQGKRIMLLPTSEGGMNLEPQDHRYEPAHRNAGDQIALRGEMMAVRLRSVHVMK